MPGDYQALAWRDNAQMLVRNASGVELLSNICRHRQAIMFDGRGSAPNIVCPIHRWTYDLKGELLGAPHFEEQPCVKLHSTPLKHWNGLLFDGPRDVATDLAGMRVGQGSRFLGLRARPDRDARMQLQLEDVHRGLSRGLSRRTVPSRVSGQFVTCDDLAWQFGDRYSLQTVGVNNGLAKPGTKTYERWHKAVLDYYQRQDRRRTARSG